MNPYIVFLVYILAVNVKLTTARIRWFWKIRMNTSRPTFSRYNVSLKSRNEYREITALYNKSSVMFSNLTMGKLYTVKVTAIAKNGDFAIAPVMFYSPGNYYRKIYGASKHENSLFCRRVIMMPRCKSQAFY